MKPKTIVKKLLKIFALLLFISTLLKVYYDLKLFDLMLGIFEVEHHNKRAALVSKKSLTFITRQKDAAAAIVDRMLELGWHYIDTYGNGYVFSNDEEEILLKRTDYPIGYSTFEVSPGAEYRTVFKNIK